MGERTGSRVFQWVWSYVVLTLAEDADGGMERDEDWCQAIH
ncbi:hypothetical protein CTRU02_205692 [Colletotrichum truncatum]|uniref:Uncharacterized protein n=1 Tax=Colletotrichum truncatum TaxID=5467 RepID=A0ACC3Z4R2_COLTU